MFDLFIVLLVQSLLMLVLVLPIIFPFSGKRHWISQIFIVVVSIVVAREHLSSLYYMCDVSTSYGAGHGLGHIFFTYYTFILLAVFTFNIVMRFIRSSFKVNFVDFLIIAILTMTTLHVSKLYEHLSGEGGCEKIEPLATFMFVYPKEIELSKGEN